MKMKLMPKERLASVSLFVHLQVHRGSPFGCLPAMCLHWNESRSITNSKKRILAALNGFACQMGRPFEAVLPLSRANILGMIVCHR